MESEEDSSPGLVELPAVEIETFELAKLRRRRQRSKNIWASYKKDFNEAGWDYIPLYKKFTNRFVLPPGLVKLIFEHPSFEKSFPRSSVLSQPDLFLAMLYKLNKGCECETVSDIFGGHANTHSSNFNKYVDASIFFFRNCINLPTRLECQAKQNKLEQLNYINPEAIFIADCCDSPVHTTNTDFYTPKKCCPSNHAVRVIKKKKSSQRKNSLILPFQNLVVVDRLSSEIVFASYVT